MRPRAGRKFCGGACRARASRIGRDRPVLEALDRVARAVVGLAVELEAARAVVARRGRRQAGEGA